MKNIHKYIMLFIVAFAVASCTDDEVVSKKVLGQTGDDVQFGLSLKNSRTVYGDGNVDEDGQVVSYPIYWVDGDKVFVFSPECLDGRRGAEYKVILPDEGNAYYAKDLEKTGDFGVQWGEAKQAVFYSLYPSGAYGLSDDGTIAKGIVVNYSQNIIVDGENIKSDMEDCLLYARADGGEENGYLGVPKGEVVNLQYDPITTVFRIKLNVPSTSADDFTIQSVSITAPDGVNIAGKFGINVADGTFAGFDDNKARTVSAAISDKNTGGFYTLTKGNSLEIPLFLAPVNGLTTDGWVIKVVANGKEYKKTLGAQTVVPRSIHMVTLPDLATKQPVVEDDWDPATWMSYIPRNVYLSEISIPGTWNSLNVDCQSELSIANQYGKGVRAFHLDTRWRVDNTPGLNVGDNPSFTGIWGDDPDITELSVATGGSGTTYKCDGGNLMRKKSALTFSEYLGQITKEVKEDEYMVVFCTFSQNSYNGDRCPSTWYQAVSNACAKNDKVYDASNLTSSTVVGDVLNHVIVVVNLDASVSSATLPTNSRCLFTYVPMQLPSNHYDASTSHTDALYYGSKSSSGISMYTSHAQISTTGTSAVNCSDRGYSHPLTKRDALVESFWDWSKGNYGTTNYNHDKWIYLGLGGYIMTSSSSSGSGYDTIENRYGPMVYDRIEEMGQNKVPFYPVGIILMNNKKGSNYTDSNGTDLKYGFSDVCKKILLLNNKYRLQYDPSKPSDYDPNYVQPGTGDDESEVEGDA